MARRVTYRNGKEKVYLSEKEKIQKYESELKCGCQLTNTGKIKKDRFGNPKRLTASQRSWRGGRIAGSKAARAATERKRTTYNGGRYKGRGRK